MRYYDISGRLAVFNLAHAVTTTHNTAVVFSAGTDQTAAANAVLPIDRTGYYSYIAHVVVTSALDASGETLSVEMKMQSSTSATSAATFTAGVSDVTSLTSTAANYKQLYLNATGSETLETDVSAGFQDQPYVWTADADFTSGTVKLDARIFGSFRDSHLTGKYVAPWVTVQDNEDDADVTRTSVNLILGGGDQMPVFEAGTAGTSTYYSKGQ
jgi:hypothetical protein